MGGMRSAGAAFPEHLVAGGRGWVTGGGDNGVRTTREVFSSLNREVNIAPAARGLPEGERTRMKDGKACVRKSGRVGDAEVQEKVVGRYCLLEIVRCVICLDHSRRWLGCRTGRLPTPEAAPLLSSTNCFPFSGL
jgi:hypothetical protein